LRASNVNLIARSRSSSGYFRGAAILDPPWLDGLHQTRHETVLWMPHGTVRKVPDGAHIDPIYPVSRKDRIIADLTRGDWHYQDHTWEVSTLVAMRPADSYAV